jgi:hypothetical protein
MSTFATTGTLQHIRFKTANGEIKGHVSKVQGRAVKVTPHAQVNAQIKSVVTIGKEDLNGAEATRADLVLGAFKGLDSLLSSPFVRKIFFPNYPLDTLKWPELPTTQPKIDFTYRPLNTSQTRAVERCLSNKEEDRHVVIVVSSAFPLSCPFSRRAAGTSRYWEDHRDRRCSSEQGRRGRLKHSLGHRTIERRSQERCGETSRLRFLGLQAPRLEGFPFRLVSSSGCKTLIG